MVQELCTAAFYFYTESTVYMSIFLVVMGKIRIRGVLLYRIVLKFVYVFFIIYPLSRQLGSSSGRLSYHFVHDRLIQC